METVMVRHVTHGGEEKCGRILMGKPEGKRPLGRPRREQYDCVRFEVVTWVSLTIQVFWHVTYSS
jgi:hypothetical protein